MRRTTSWLVLFSLAIAVATSGCAARPGAGRPPVEPLRDPREIAAAFAARGRTVKSLRAVAKVRYLDPAERYSARQALVIARPDRVRVEVFTMLGTAFVLTAQERYLVAWWPEKNTVFTGMATAENLWRYTRIWIPVEMLVDVLLAIVGANSAQPATCPATSPAAACLRRDTAGYGALLVELDPRGLPTEVTELGVVDGSVLWRARYLEYSYLTSPPAAARVVLEVPRYQRSVHLHLEDVEINPALSPDTFQLARPPGVRTVDLDEQEAE